VATRAKRTKDQRIAELYEIQNRGEAMEKLFEDPLTSGFFVEYERRAMDELLKCKIDDHEGRLSRSVAINISRQFLQEMGKVIESGKKASKDIARITEKAEKNG